MARDVKQAVVDDVDYAPDIDNNRDDPDPFYVTMTPMTAGEMNAAERAMGVHSGGQINFTERAQKQLRAILAERVHHVFNYSIPHRQTGARITPQNGTELYDAILNHGAPDERRVIDDIYEALKSHSHLRAGLLETLRSRSGSRAPGTPRSGGAAGGVDGATNPATPDPKTT